MEEQQHAKTATTCHHKLSNTDSPRSRPSSAKSDTDNSNSDGESGGEFRGAPLGARISYHTGLNLEEKEAFKLCFPGLDGKDTENTTEPGAGDTIDHLITKMRRTMGSVDPHQVTSEESSLSEDEVDSFVEVNSPGSHLTPVHKTESLVDLTSNLVPVHKTESLVDLTANIGTGVPEGEEPAVPPKKTVTVHKGGDVMVPGSSHHIGDAGKARPMVTSSHGLVGGHHHHHGHHEPVAGGLKTDDPHLHVFAEGHSAHTTTDTHEAH